MSCQQRHTQPLIDLLAEGRKAEAHQLKMLAGKRNADDGDSQQQPESQVRQSNPDTANKYPDNIEDGRKTTRLTGYLSHLPAKRQQRKQPDFETLQAEGDADNG